MMSVELGPLPPVAEFRRPTIDDYRHFWTTEAGEIGLLDTVLEARRIQAAGYRDAGHVTDDAVSPDGTLWPAVDGATGPGVEYHVATSNPNSTNGLPGDAALRVARLLPGQTYADHPWYKMAGEAITPEGRAYLESIPPENLGEVSGFATVKGPEQLYWLLGQAAQKAGKNDVWVFGIVKKTFDAVSHTLGPRNFQVLGEPVPAEKEYVNPGVEIVPAVLVPSKMAENAALSYFDAVREGNELASRRLLKTLKIITHGATDEERGEVVNAALWYASRMAATKPVGKHAVRDSLMEYPEGVEPLVGRTAERKEQPGWSEPLQYKFSGPEDFQAVVASLQVLGETDGLGKLDIDDQIEAIAKDLFAAKYPQYQHDKGREQAFVAEWMAQGEQAGTWFYFPWSHKLVRYADQEDHLLLRTYRNRNLVTTEQQESLYYGKTIAICGQSVGAEITKQTVQAGIGDTIILADFDRISWSNLNRLRAGGPSVGVYKIDETAQYISELDPYVRQIHLRDGLTPDNLGTLLQYKPDFVFDAVDNLPAKVLLRQAARETGTTVVMMTDAGQNVVVDIESGETKRRKLFNGRVPQSTIDKILNGERPTPREALDMTVKVAAGGWLKLLKIADEPLLDSLSKLGTELTGFPQLGSTVALAGSLAVDIMRAAILHQPIDTMPRHNVVNPNKALGLQQVNNSLLKKINIVRAMRRAVRKPRKA